MITETSKITEKEGSHILLLRAISTVTYVRLGELLSITSELDYALRIEIKALKSSFLGMEYVPDVHLSQV